MSNFVKSHPFTLSTADWCNALLNLKERWKEELLRLLMKNCDNSQHCDSESESCHFYYNCLAELNIYSVYKIWLANQILILYPIGYYLYAYKRRDPDILAVCLWVSIFGVDSTVMDVQWPLDFLSIGSCKDYNIHCKSLSMQLTVAVCKEGIFISSS